MSITTTDGTMTVTLSADEANAVVYAVAAELVHAEAGSLESMPCSTAPGALFGIAECCRRIAALSDVNDQLLWRMHFGRDGGEPPALTATAAVLLDVVAVLHRNGEDQRRHRGEEGYEETFEFDRAARTIARAFAAGEASA